MSRLPQWKQRAIAAEKAVEKAQRAERYQRFWEAVQPPRYIEDQPDTFVRPAVIGEDFHGPIG